jgi:predicted metal-dependent hydrolase
MPSELSQRRPTVPVMTYTTEPPTLFLPDVEVRVSKRRKKTAGAHWEGDRIVVVVPTHLRGAERDAMVEALSQRLIRHRPHLHASDEVLEQRSLALGRRYLDGVAPASIRWSTTQNKRWGSCTADTREIRISERLRVVPDWVLDAVIVHELAHLFVPDHSPRFRQLEHRYPRQGEADLFLQGYALGLHMPDPACDGGSPTDETPPASAIATDLRSTSTLQVPVGADQGFHTS